MTKADFISRTMQIMNELGWDDISSGAFFNSDATKVEKHIESVFVDAWRKATALFPKVYFESRDFSASKLTYDISTGTGFILLPADFYLLFSFKMKGWQKRVETAYLFSDPIASVQANEYTRGNHIRPVVIRTIKPVLTREGDNFVTKMKDALEYYSLPKGKVHQVEEAIYIPLIQPLSDETILNEKLIAPLAYLCASQVFIIFEKSEIAKVLELKATEIIR